MVYIIGIWNLDGSIYDAVNYPVKKQVYIDSLLDIVVYDSNGIELSRERPVSALQINKFFGMNDRIMD